jgi:hypothetical protein
MSSFDTTLLNVYLIGFFSLAVTAVVLAIAVAAYELARHRHLRLSHTASPSAEGGSTSPPIVDVPAGPRGSAGDGLLSTGSR